MLIETISPTDSMLDRNLTGAIEHYFSVGYSAMRCINGALNGAQPKLILDIPCGHGRVTRHLRAAFPDAELFVSDLDEEGMKFSAGAFSAKALLSNADFDQVDFGLRFDLIWVGSLVTHLDAERNRAFFRFLARHLAPSGSAVVTFHGAFVAGRLFDRAVPIYGLTLENERALFNDYISTGFSYRPYPFSEDGSYGVSLATPEWMAKQAALSGLMASNHADHAWDTHQDTITLRLR